eukprot:12414594-Karenia_brevis.AAC.2
MGFSAAMASGSGTQVEGQEHVAQSSARFSLHMKHPYSHVGLDAYGISSSVDITEAFHGSASCIYEEVILAVGFRVRVPQVPGSPAGLGSRLDLPKGGVGGKGVTAIPPPALVFTEALNA